MNEKEIRALLEGAYAQTPTLPGFFVKYDEFRSRFNKLVEKRSDLPLDVEKILEEYYPEARFEDCYQPQGSDEVFKAFRIAPNKLKCIIELKKKIDAVLKSIQTDSDGWFNFAVVGTKINKEDYLAMGFIGIRQTIECLFRSRIEFRTGDPSKHEAPVQARDLKTAGNGQQIIDIPAQVPEKTLRPKQGSYIGEAIDKFAFFPRPKSASGVVYGWDAAINELAVNVALDERWYYNENEIEKQTKPILKNYLSYTFERLQYEDEIESKKAKEENRQPRLKILENKSNAIFNTGLVDSIYEPIYAFFGRNTGKNPSITQPWVFIAFATANSYLQNIITDFAYKPARAEYFTNPNDLFYDFNAQKPTINWEHIIKDNIERLPLGFVKKGAPEGFPFIDNVDALPKPQRRDYFTKLAKAIYDDEDWLRYITSRFKDALDIALSRVAWNYKTAIPVYYVTEHKLSLLLPLALEKKGEIDVALVCEHKVDESNGVNNYVGRTIFTLQMAYNNARLITRPDSDWLMAGMCVKK